jgi:hypothetical protein
VNPSLSASNKNRAPSGALFLFEIQEGRVASGDSKRFIRYIATDKE